MSGVLNNPEVARQIDVLCELLVPARWHASRKLAARNLIEALATRACQIGTTGAGVTADRAIAVHCWRQAVDLAVIAEPSECESAEEMKARIVATLALMRDQAKGRAA